jgi:general L-amino acid transport system permease protein
MNADTKSLAPPATTGPIDWLKKNLFSSWFNAVLTVILLPFVFFAVVAMVRWVFFTANWRPVTEFPILYLIGQYPRDQLWRPGISLLLLVSMIGLSWGVWEQFIKPLAVFLAILLAVLALAPVASPTVTLSIRVTFLVASLLIYVGYRIGRLAAIKGSYIAMLWLVILALITLVVLPGFEKFPALPKVPTTAWGGLMVTLLLAVGGIGLSFPIGVLLALGRRSSLPVVKVFSILFIEIVRGVPLITILFMFSIILALFLPTESRIDRVIRALIAMVVFSSAYTAENVRGGLQAVPRGQEEAAKALGLNNLQITLFIVLPQALRAVIPAIVGQFISLFKDTTLVVIVGINDLLGIGKSVLNADPQFIRLQAEVYIFIAAVFWVFSYFMSYASRQLEKVLGVGER